MKDESLFSSMIMVSISDYIDRDIVIIPSNGELFRLYIKFRLNRIFHIAPIKDFEFLEEISFALTKCNSPLIDSFNISSNVIYEIDFMTSESDKIYTSVIGEVLYYKIMDTIEQSTIYNDFLIRIHISSDIDVTDIDLIESNLTSNVLHFVNSYDNLLIPLLNECQDSMSDEHHIIKRSRSMILNNIIS